MVTATKTAKKRAYWVRCTTTLCDYSHESPHLQPFLSNLSREMSRDKTAHVPAVFTYGDGTIVIAAVLEAKSEGTALDAAKVAYADAVIRAGGSFRHDDDDDDDDDSGDGDGWVATQLLKWTVDRVEVEEIKQTA